MAICSTVVTHLCITLAPLDMYSYLYTCVGLSPVRKLCELKIYDTCPHFYMPNNYMHVGNNSHLHECGLVHNFPVHHLEDDVMQCSQFCFYLFDLDTDYMSLIKQE